MRRVFFIMLVAAVSAARAPATGNAETASQPEAVVVSCVDCDTHLWPSLEERLGRFGVIRSVGACPGSEQIVQAEQAVIDGARHIVVITPTDCQAVRCALFEDESPVYSDEQIAPVIAAAEAAIDRLGFDAPHDRLIELTARFAAFRGAADLIRSSPLIAQRVAAGKLSVATALMHDGSGRVEWMGPHPDQSQLIALHASAETPTTQVSTGVLINGRYIVGEGE